VIRNLDLQEVIENQDHHAVMESRDLLVMIRVTMRMAIEGNGRKVPASRRMNKEAVTVG